MERGGSSLPLSFPSLPFPFPPPSSPLPSPPLSSRSPPLPLPSPSCPFPVPIPSSPPLLLKVGPLGCGYGVWGSAISSPSGSGQARPPNAFWCIFSLSGRILASIFKQLVLSKITITYPSPIFSDFSFQKCDASAEAYLISSPNPPSHPSLPFLTLPLSLRAPLPPLLFPPFLSLLYISSMTCCFWPSFLFNCVIFFFFFAH